MRNPSRRSQVGFSRRLGFRTNVAYSWESGRRSPSMTQVFRACRLVGIDVAAAIQSFFAPLPWLAGADLETKAAIARLIREVRGDLPVSGLADRAGCSRFALSRWQSGRSTPRLRELFALVHAAALGWFALIAPIAMLLSVRFFTGVPFTEKRALASRGDDYRRYMAETNAFFLWLPPKPRLQ